MRLKQEVGHPLLLPIWGLPLWPGLAQLLAYQLLPAWHPRRYWLAGSLESGWGGEVAHAPGWVGADSSHLEG